MEIKQKLKIIRILSIFTFTIGVLLIIYMIRMEGEPGALPLFLILSGIVLYLIYHLNYKKLKN